MKIRTKCFLFITLCLIILGMTPSVLSKSLRGDDKKAFLEGELEWRDKRDKEMRAPTSWLNIAGLFWLKEGENRFGTEENNPIMLPERSAPPLAGSFFLKDGKVTVSAEPGIPLKINGNTVQKSELKGDDTGNPDIVELNDLRLWVIERFGQYAIRMRDLNHPPYKKYKGLDFFPPNAKYKIQADFFPYPETKKVEVGTVVGKNTEINAIGYVTFKIDGKAYRLEASSVGPKTLYFIFGDETNGKETYEASRFMSARILESGKVDLNFNRAFNPPCAYTPFATCPLPPSQNQLKTQILAGEKKYPDSPH